MRPHLKAVTLKGFKTIESLENFALAPMTVLIGPNGAGKSNFLSFFSMLSWALADPDHLPLYVAQHGGASALLHGGASRTQEIEAALTVQAEEEESEYSFRLVHAAGDSLVFADERRRTLGRAGKQDAKWEVAEPGHRYPRLLADSGEHPGGAVGDLLRRTAFYQFHNTSDTARIRGKWSVGDNRSLKWDAGNLASVLYRLREAQTVYYRRIVSAIRVLLPWFSDFELEPEHGRVLLKWAREEPRRGVRCLAGLRRLTPLDGSCHASPAAGGRSAGSSVARRT